MSSSSGSSRDCEPGLDARDIGADLDGAVGKAVPHISQAGADAGLRKVQALQATSGSGVDTEWGNNELAGREEERGGGGEEGSIASFGTPQRRHCALPVFFSSQTWHVHSGSGSDAMVPGVRSYSLKKRVTLGEDVRNPE
jgi:hypothetical protein